MTDDTAEVPIKSSPFDINTFRQETSVKYPTFTPPAKPGYAQDLAAGDTLDIAASSPVSPLKLAQAFSPIPVRHHYHHGDEADFQSATGLPPNPNGPHPAFQQQAHPSYNTNPTQQPMTPMPTPPPSPKPKKQQYQTDQNRPFLFPFSRMQYSRSRDARLVPYAIDEADKLYSRHMHVSVALMQMWRTREDCMIAESGLQRMPGSENTFDTFESILGGNGGNSSTNGSSAPALLYSDRRGSDGSYRDDFGDATEDLPDVILLNAKIAEIEAFIQQADARGGDRTELKKLKEANEKREDLLRLKRVEQIYVSLPPTDIAHN